MARKEIEDLDIEAIIRLLQKRPDLRERLREVLLTEEERQLPLQIKQLVEAIHELTLAHREGVTRIERLEAAVERLEATVAQLASSHQEALGRLDRLEAAVERLEATVAQLASSHQEALGRLDRLEATVAQLASSHQEALGRLDRLEATVAQLASSHQEALGRLDRLEALVEELIEWSRYARDELAELKGMSLETRYFLRAPAVFGYHVRRPRVVDVGQFMDKLREQGHTLTEEEGEQLSAIDVLLSARHPKTGQPIYIVLEVTWMVYPTDVERSYQQAEILRARGLEVYPAVAGKGIHPEANELVERHRVILLLDSKMVSRGGLGG